VNGAELPIGIDDIRAAAARLAPWVHRTPVMTSRTLDEACGGSIWLKCENLQRVGAFKFRGAMNALLQLEADRKAAGVVTHSSGNHAQALALAGKLLGVPVCIVMPRTAPAVKRTATEGYGARIVPCEPTLAAREATLAELVARHGYEVVHPFDDWRVIAGQGTAALELLEQAGPLDVVAVPCGGGGLLSGTALVVKAVTPATRVVGVEPAAADDARRSLAEGRIIPSGDPTTLADGLRTSLGERTFAVIRRHADEIVTVSEEAILDAMRFVLERVKLVVEPSAAVPVAAVQTRAIPAQGLRVGVVLSGGNVDLAPLFAALAGR
jgi:threonine dehydratase